MELKEYQEKAMTTCMPSSENFAYMFDNLLGEVGELCEKVNDHTESLDLIVMRKRLCDFGHDAKKIRKEPNSLTAKIELNKFNVDVVLRMRQDTNLQKEIGDILWQLAGLCSVMGWSLEDIAQQNLDKLASRQERGKIDGDGDNR